VGPHLTQCGQGRGLPACQVSSSSIQPFGHSTPTSQTGQDRQTDRQTCQWSDSIGRTVLQMVAQKMETLRRNGPVVKSVVSVLNWKGDNGGKDL